MRIVEVKVTKYIIGSLRIYHFDLTQDNSIENNVSRRVVTSIGNLYSLY